VVTTLCSTASNRDVPKTGEDMPPSTLKLATFNAEWMCHLFTKGKPTLRSASDPVPKAMGSVPHNPEVVARRLAQVISEVKPAILGMCEGPATREQMQSFVKTFLGDAFDVYSMPDGNQSVHTLVRKKLPRGCQVSQLDDSDPVFRRLRKQIALHRFGEVQEFKPVKMTRLPVILRLTYKNRTAEIATFHSKSKFSKLKSRKDWENLDRDKVIDAIFARQKLSAEMNAIRKYIAHTLYSKRADSVIVMGDFNDGVSPDPVDNEFLLHSMIHQLRGAFQHEIALMSHALTQKELQDTKQFWTVEFRSATHAGKKTRVLLDHILYSKNVATQGPLRFQAGSARIESAAFDAAVARGGKTRDDRPSDHRPLSASFELV
jgi:hypothetical protein